MLPFIDEKYVYPEKAKEKLKLALEKNQPVYIHAKAGYGKTSLVAKYLARRKYTYFDALTSNVNDLETVDEDIKILVVDNLQYLNENYIQEKILDFVRDKDRQCIFISRGRCPEWLTNEYYRYESFVSISDNNLELNLYEIKQYFVYQGLEDVTEQELNDIKTLTRGHGLSLRLLCECMIEMAEGTGRNYVLNDTIYSKARYLLWDYLEQASYKNWDQNLADFVMQVSIVNKFTIELAEAITGSSKATYYLEQAEVLGNFIRKDNEYYSFDEEVLLSMRRRLAVKCDERKRKELYYNAGHYYRTKGMLIEALEMFEKAGYDKLIGDILIECAKDNPSSGYVYELRKYYLELDEEIIKSKIELMSGLSMIYSLQMNPDKSDYWYECLKERVEQSVGYEKKLAKGYVAYLDLALPHRGSSNTIQVFKNMGTLFMNREISIPDVGTTSNAPSLMNGGKDFSEWSKKDKELAASIGKIMELVLGKAGAGIVELALAESFFEKGGADYEIIRYLSKGQMIADSKGKIEMSYVAAGLMARLHLMNGNVEDAIEVIEVFRERAKQERKPKLINNIDSFLCHLKMYCEDKNSIISWFEKKAPDENKEFFIMDRYSYLTKIHIYIAMNKLNQAYTLLQKLEYYAQCYERPYVRIQALILLADIEYEQKYDNWKETFQQAITLAEEYGFVRVISSEATIALKLLKADKWEFKDQNYKKRVYEETALMAEQYPGYMSSQVVLEEVIEKNALRILKMQAMGMSNEKIASELSLSVSTVKYHCKENYRKLGVNGKAAAIAEARKRQLI